MPRRSGPSAARQVRYDAFESAGDSGARFPGWQVQLEGERALTTPAIAGGRAFLGGGFGSYEFYAFDLKTGQQAWQIQTHDDGPTAATVVEDRVLFNTESCTLTVVDAATGRLVWEHWLGDPLLAQPAAGEGRVFMAWPAKGDHLLGAFALDGGAKLWTAHLGADVITAPVVTEGFVYVSTYDGRVSCFESATGRQTWTREMQATSAPWVYRGEVFVSRRDDSKSAAGTQDPHEETSGFRGHAAARRVSDSRRAHYLRSKRGTRWEAFHKAHDASVGFGQAPASAKLEHVHRLIGETSIRGAWHHQGSRPCVWRGRVFATAGDVLSATDLAGAQGKEIWSWQAPASEVAQTLSPPAVCNGRVYAGGRDGFIRSWDAATGALRWQASVEASAIWQPAIWHGWVYAGLGGGRMVALRTGDPLDHGWPMWGGGAGHNG